MLRSKTHKLKVLTFDIENRPLSYWMEKEPTAEITAICAGWEGDISSIKVWLLGIQTLEEILTEFVKMYDEADMVVGHYIRKHDLPIINGALMELGMPQLKPKLTHDTKLDMVKKASIPATQEYLCELLGIPFQKVHMTQADWREANRLTPKGIEATRRRVTGDVLGHMMMRAGMLERGLLRSPSIIWRP